MKYILAFILGICFLATIAQGDEEFEFDKAANENLDAADTDKQENADNEDFEFDEKEENEELDSAGIQEEDKELDAQNEKMNLEEEELDEQKQQRGVKKEPRAWGVRIPFIRRRRRRLIPPIRRIIRRTIRRTISRALRRLLDGFIPSCRRSGYRRGNAPRLSGGPPNSCIYSNNLYHQAKCWAPLIYLAIGEKYKPSSVSFFLRNMMVIRNRKIIQRNPSMFNMPKGCKNCFLATKGRLRTPRSTLSFFGGEKASCAPIYSFWRQKKVGNKMIRDFIYFAFYPYNLGKKACIGGVINKRCIGKCMWLGNHVGDWEHVTVRLENNRPSKMYVGAHDFGYIFNWNAQRRTFVRGKDSIKFSSQGHPIVYSALGSHGKYIWRNRLTYKSIPNGEKLQDLTSTGTPWKTWENVELIHYKNNLRYTGRDSWMNYRGRWGNPERGCKLRKITKSCVMEDGPTSPSEKSVLTSYKLD